MPGLPASCPGGEVQGPRWLDLTLPLVLAQMALGRIKGFFQPVSGKAARPEFGCRTVIRGPISLGLGLSPGLVLWSLGCGLRSSGRLGSPGTAGDAT